MSRRALARRTGLLAILRRLSPRRTRSRFGRLVATTLAILVSLLLVGSVGPVYADGTASGTTSGTATTGTTTTAATTSGPLQSSTVTQSAAGPSDTPDWAWQGGAPTLSDGTKDGSAYSNGSAESGDPQRWGQGTSNSPKDDLVKYYLNVDTSDDIIATFGFTRAAITGDTAFAAEFNQQQNYSDSPPQPHRTTGDLLMKFHVDGGNSPLTFVHAFLWEPTSAFSSFESRYPALSGCQEFYGSGSGWCEIPRGGFDARVADGGYTAEGKVDLTELFSQTGCSAIFNEVNLRSESSSENWNNELKDYLVTPGVSVPSTCSTLVIEKFRAGTSTLLPGAHFAVYQGGAATGTPLYSDVYDGKAGVDTDGAGNGTVTLTGVEPGTYTVQETQAPPGYFLPSGADATRTVTVGKHATGTFSFGDVKRWQALDVQNTAHAGYVRTYRWQLDKGVGDSAAGPFSSTDTRRIPASADDTASFGYRIKVTEDGYADSQRTVSGKLTVTNPNDEPVTVHLADELADGTTCTFPASTVSVPGDDQPHDFAYTCAPSTVTATGSHGSVTWSRADYPQSQADAGATGDYSVLAATTFGWAETPVHRSVTVTDNRYDLGTDGWRITYGQGTSTTHVTTYSRDLTGTDGTCTDSTNTATLTADDDAGYTRTASATATLCVGRDLVVTKDASPTLTRTYSWQVTKTADQARITTASDGTASAGFTLHVLAGSYADSQWAMTGAITVSNPNDWGSIELTGLSDHFDGGVDGHETCVITDWGSVGHVVAAGASRTYHYSCTFDQQPSYDGTNTATATWDGSAAATPDSSADGTVAVDAGQWAEVTSVDRTVDLFDDGGSHGATWTRVNDSPIEWQPGLDRSFHYDLPVTVAPGTCQTFTNAARVVSGGVQLAQAGASVDACNPQGLTVAKTADASFVRTYHWTIQKSVADPTTVHEPSYSHQFDYTVTATPNGSTDGHWTLDGTIHVANPNTDGSIPPVSTTVTDTPVGVGGGAVCTVNDGDDTVTLASGQSVDLPYRCTFTGRPGDGTNVATATWDGGQATGSAPVHFTQGGSVDQSVQVWDDEVTGPAQLLGTATWGEQPTSFHYSRTLTAPSPACADFVNHAWLTAVDGTDHLGDASATATICPVPGTWRVVKTSAPVDGSTVLPGQTITYHVTVSKTGGVDPSGVVVEDDLSSVVDHTGDPAISAPAGTTATYDPATHVLTWDVGTVSGTQTLDYSVRVDDGAFGVTLVNHLTSQGSDNCSPADVNADDCSTVHYTPKWSLTKTSDPAAGAQVLPGDAVTYTLRVVNTGPATLSGARVSDDLSDVLDDATLRTPLADGLAFDGDHTLTWSVPDVAPGGSAKVSYTVTVGPHDGATLRNVATPTTPGGSCETGSACSTTQFTPEWTLSKSSDPATGSQVLPGQRVGYTLTVTNTGPAPLTGATVRDDLSDVLDDATWDGDATGDGPASLSGSTLTWQVADLAPGRSATLTYSVTVEPGADGETLRNVATPTTPGGSCATQGGCSTTQFTPEWTLSKSSDPQSGSTVVPGEDVEYTLTVTNTGPATLSGARVSDDLSDVLDDATLQSPLAAGLTRDGDALVWSVPVVAPGGSATVSYTVAVDEHAWKSTLRNVATPGTPGGSCATDGGCSTTSHTPHYTLSKASSVAPGGSVLPPYLGAAGDTVGYTLTAHNDSQGVVEGATVTDDLSDVLDDATFDDASIVASAGGTAERSGDTLTWRLPTMQPGQTATVSYSVTVDADRWDESLTNTATPDAEGDCVLDNGGHPLCSTTVVTPPYTRIAVKKVDAETGAALAGATFSLASQEAPGTVLGTATSGADGIAVFPTKLQPGGYLVTETAAPAGYDLPAAGQDTLPVTVQQPGEGSNFVADGVMAPIEFRDPAQGQLALLAKEQYRLASDGTWQKMADTDTVAYGDEVKYVVPVAATGPRLFHDVTLTDYVPGYNPADTTSTGRATLVPGSADCTGDLTCTVTVDDATGLVTWSAGALSDATGAMEMVVRFPELPDNPAFDANGRYTTTLWNVGYLDWDEAGPAAPPLVHHELASNAVLASATYVESSPPVQPPHNRHPHRPPHHNPPPQPPSEPPHGAPPPAAPALPNTGGPQWWYLPTGLGLLLLGAGLLLGREGRRRREA